MKIDTDSLDRISAGSPSPWVLKEWLAADDTLVRIQTPICLIGNVSHVAEVEAFQAGRLHHLIAPGSMITPEIEICSINPSEPTP